MKLIKTASNVEIKMSHKEWLEIGNKAGWTKEAGTMVYMGWTVVPGREKGFWVASKPGVGQVDIRGNTMDVRRTITRIEKERSVPKPPEASQGMVDPFKR